MKAVTERNPNVARLGLALEYSEDVVAVGFDEDVGDLLEVGKAVEMPYWSIPEDAFDDPDLMAHWVRLAYEAALRTPTKPAKSSRRSPTAT